MNHIYFKYLSANKLSNLLENLWRWLTFSVKNHENSTCMPIFLSIETSSVCNLSCPECAVGQGRTLRYNHLLTLETFRHIIDQTASTLLHVQLYFQGEPLLNNQIGAMIQYAHNHRIMTTLSTNAMLLTPKIAQTLIDTGLDKLIVSLDGTTQQTYEIYRQGGILNQVLQNVHTLTQLKRQKGTNHPIVETQMIVFHHNEHQINDFRRLSTEIGADQMVLKSAQIYNFSEKASQIPTNKKYARYVFRNNHWQIKRTSHRLCRRIYSGLVVDCDGNLLPCCFDKRPSHILGNIADSTIREVWNGNTLAAFRSKVLKNRTSIDICNNCTE